MIRTMIGFVLELQPNDRISKGNNWHSMKFKR